MRIREALVAPADVVRVYSGVGDTDEVHDELFLRRRDDAARLRIVALGRVTPAMARTFAWTRGLRKLSIHGATLGDAGCETLMSAIGAIESLNLSGCALRSPSALALAAMLRTNTTLVHLFLSWNRFDAPSLSVFGDAVGANGSLRTLTLNGVNASSQLYDSMLRALERHSSLRHVDLGNYWGPSSVSDTFTLAANRVLRALDVTNSRYADAFLIALYDNASVTSFSSGDCRPETLIRFLARNQTMRFLTLDYLSRRADVCRAFETNTTVTAFTARDGAVHADVAASVHRNAERRYVHTYGLLCCRPALRELCGAREIYVRIATAVLAAIGGRPQKRARATADDNGS